MIRYLQGSVSIDEVGAAVCAACGLMNKQGMATERILVALKWALSQAAIDAGNSPMDERVYKIREQITPWVVSTCFGVSVHPSKAPRVV